MKLSFHRPAELAREVRHLPAPLYNLARRLLERSAESCVFVPIRSMQYLAVLDREEFLFIDSERKSVIAMAWQNFRPGRRNALDAPVAFEAVYYDAHGPETMKRLQGDFERALRLLAAKDAPPRAADSATPVLDFGSGRGRRG